MFKLIYSLCAFSAMCVLLVVGMESANLQWCVKCKNLTPHTVVKSGETQWAEWEYVQCETCETTTAYVH